VPDRGVLLDPGPGPRGLPGRGPQRLSRDPGRDHLPRRPHDGHQPHHRHALQAGRPAGGPQMSAVTEAVNPVAIEAPVVPIPPVAEIPKSPSVWAEAWMRLKRDRVGMVSLYVVAVFMVLVLLAQVGVIASGWSEESGLPFAPPTFVGPDAAVQELAKKDDLPLVDLTDIDPLAPKYAEWNKRASEIKTETKQL